MGQGVDMASDYYYTTGDKAGQPKPGMLPATEDPVVTTELPDGFPAKPDDWESVPYDYDVDNGQWVKFDQGLG
tara:strand:- start:52 stop:270 length:219 start_codon:yes stop_codon:yes gene_type:complete